MNRTMFIGALVMPAYLAALSGCSKSQVAAASNEAPLATVQPVPDLNVMTVEGPERFVLATVESRRESDQLTANGIVSPDVSRTVPVNQLTSGRVVSLFVRIGDDVKPGQLLLTMTSPDMSQAISDYQKFQTDEALTKSQFERAQTLSTRGAIAQKDVDVAQNMYEKAKVDVKTAAERIRILGGDVQHPSALIEVRAPVAGTIIEQNVTSAAGVKSPDSSPNLFTIADLSQVWVLCDVYENNLAQVHVGDSADIELNAYPNRRLRGRITNIGKVLDPNTRAAKVRIELSNEGGILRPNMFATAHFLSQGQQTRGVVPASAILRSQDRDWAFIKIGEKQFRRTEVQPGPMNSDGTQQVLSGLRIGGQVVANALQFDREAQKD